MNLTGLDHLVLTVEDLAASCAFYEGLGGEVETYGDDRTAVRFGDQKINLHPVDDDVDLVAAEPTPGSGDVCLLTDAPVEAVEEDLRERGVEVVAGPVARSGGVGEMTSVYVRDPDDNLVEIATPDDD